MALQIQYIKNSIHSNYLRKTYLQKCLFVLQIENNKQLAASFSRLKYCGKNHNYAMIGARKLLNIPSRRADKYSK